MKPNGKKRLEELEKRSEELRQEIAQFRRYCQDWEEQKEVELTKLAQDYRDLYQEITGHKVIMPLNRNREK